MNMVAHGAGHTNFARGALGLEPRRDVDRVTVQIRAIRDRIADLDPHTKTDSPIWRTVSVERRDLTLHLHGTAHGTINAVEHDQQRVATSLDNLPAMFVDGRIDYLAS